MKNATYFHRIIIGTFVGVGVLVVATISSAKWHPKTSSYWDIFLNRQIKELQTIEWATRHGYGWWYVSNRWDRVLGDLLFYQRWFDWIFNSLRFYGQPIDRFRPMDRPDNQMRTLKTIEWANKQPLNRFHETNQILSSQVRQLKTVEWATRQRFEPFQRMAQFGNPRTELETIQWEKRQSLDRYSQMDMLRKAQAVLARTAQSVSRQASFNQQKYNDFMRKYSDMQYHNNQYVFELSHHFRELYEKANQEMYNVYKNQTMLASKLAFRGMFGIYGHLALPTLPVPTRAHFQVISYWDKYVDAISSRYTDYRQHTKITRQLNKNPWQTHQLAFQDVVQVKMRQGDKFLNRLNNYVNQWNRLNRWNNLNRWKLP